MTVSVFTDPHLRRIAEDGAGRMIAAVRDLPSLNLVLGVVGDLLSDEDPTLQSVGEAAITEEPGPLAKALAFAVFCNDATDLIERLNPDVAPWSTIRGALVELRDAFYAVNPGAEERRQRWRGNRGSS